MFSRIPGTIRETDEDGELDPPITPVPARQTVTDEYGRTMTNENGQPIYI